MLVPIIAQNPDETQDPYETRCEICLDYFTNPDDAPEGDYVAGNCDRHSDGDIVPFSGYLCPQHFQDCGFVGIYVYKSSTKEGAF